jgi:aspartate kinase
MKFGGTSVGSADAIAQAIEIVRKSQTEAKHVIVIVSAMSGVTNLLQEGLTSAANGNLNRYPEIVHELQEKHSQAARHLIKNSSVLESLTADINNLIGQYRLFCDGVRVLGETTPRALDYAMGLGERFSARLVAAAMNEVGLKAQAIDATELILTDNLFQSASPVMDITETKVRNVLKPLFKAGVTPVVTGFIGATAEGIPTTLGRGGSDYSAAIVGAAARSDEVWIWTDVDGVMSADPRIVPQARILDTLTYGEVSELAYYGAKVLHPKTIRPVLEAGIPLRVRNTFNASHPGTLIVENGQSGDHYIKAVTMIRDLSLITVEGKGMLGVPGIAARTFSSVARTGTSVLLITQSSSEQNICFVVPRASAKLVVDTVNSEFAQEIARRDIDRVSVDDDVAILTVVGAGMRDASGVAGAVFSAAGEAGINIIAIAQGSSECSISLVVDAADGDAALLAIHPLAL